MSEPSQKQTIFGDSPIIMGVVNVTPDSFSDGGKFINKNNAIDHGLMLLEQGAHILDIGGESSRPGALAVDPEEEIARIIPVIKGLRDKAKYISVDTRNAKTMRAALDAGANIINDISALTHDSESINVVAEAKCPVILMHMQGAPDTMQENPNYNNVIEEIFAYHKSRIDILETNGIEKEKIMIDPGIGFGKTLEHNLLILRNIKEFHALGCVLLLGTSRKSFIAKLDDNAPAHLRLGGSLSSVLWGLEQGVQMFRVHDVQETVQAFKMWSSIKGT